MARSLRRTLMVSGAAVAIGALAAIGMTSASAGTGGIGILADRTVRTGIDIPWGITFLPDRSAYVAERDTGRILRITQSGARSVVGTVPGTAFGGEGGLLGLAVAPGFNPADGRLFAYQTVSSGNRIVRIRVRSHRFGAGDVTQILGGITRSTFHNGGRLRFGPDGNLYATTGDELNLIMNGRNYGWGGCRFAPPCVAPKRTWPVAFASPSGITIINDNILIACLRGQKIIQLRISGDSVTGQTVHHTQYGRVRTVERAPGGGYWMSTSNRDANGTPRPGDDRIIHVT